MRRLGALVLAILGYALMAMFSPDMSTLPAAGALAAGAALLATRPPEARNEAERVAYELLRRR